MSDRDGILDVHGKCRREREELEGKLAAAQRELHVLHESESLADVELKRYKTLFDAQVVDRRRLIGELRQHNYVARTLHEELSKHITDLGNMQPWDNRAMFDRALALVAPFVEAAERGGANVGTCDHWMHGLDKYPRGSSMSFTERAMDEITAHRAVCPLLADSRAGQAGEAESHAIASVRTGHTVGCLCPACEHERGKPITPGELAALYTTTADDRAGQAGEEADRGD